MVGGDGAPRLLDASQTRPKDMVMDEGIDLVAECGRFVSDRFEDARTTKPNTIWIDPEDPNYEGMTMAIDDPKGIGMRQEGPGQFHTDNRLGSTRVIKQPKGGDGTEWEWDKTEYEIPQQRVVDGVESFFPGSTHNVRLRMRGGDLNLRVTTGDFSGRLRKVQDIKYFHASEGSKDKVKTSLKEAATYLSPADHRLRQPVAAK